jgi:hypothetical protein
VSKPRDDRSPKKKRAAGGIDAVRAADRARKKAGRDAAKAVPIPAPEDLKRRTRLERDVHKWLRWYFADIFTEPFREHQTQMIDAILTAATYGGDQAIAAPRGEAKTTIAECVTVHCVLKALLSFVVIFAATGREARNSLGTIKGLLAENDRLAADYPEVCLPIRAAAATPQSAHSMLVRDDGFGFGIAGSESAEGEDAEPAQAEALFQWSGDEISLPRVPGSRSAGAIVATRGLDSAVRGLKKGKVRPQLAIIDDPDTERTARNPDMAAKLADRIERAIAGLAPQGQRMSRVMLTTLQNRTCASARFTDPVQKPSWNGIRFAFLKKAPNRQDLWDQYVQLRRESMQMGDRFGREAHRLYLKHRKAMDAGGQVCNPKSFDGRKLADKTRLQVSAFQRYYDFVADNGLDAALSELQNDPPKAGKSGLALEAVQVANKINRLERGAVPLKAQHLTAMADVHDRLLYWLVAAWDPAFQGAVIDYGTWPEQPVSHFALSTASPTLADRYPGCGKEAAIAAGMKDLAARLLGTEYRREDGAAMRIGKLLFDSKYETDTVKTFCRRSPHGALIMPSQGFYIKPGVEWAAFFRNKPGGHTGFHWRIPPVTDGTRYVLLDADFWKTLATERLRIALGDPGDWSLFGREPREHALLAEHFASELPEWRQQGDAGKWHWELPSWRPDNHWWDCLIGAAVAASISGVIIPGILAGGREEDPNLWPTLGELKGKR